MYPKKFEALVESFRKLPGVGMKTAERYAFQTLEWDEETLDGFIQSLADMKDGLKKCEVCGNLAEGDLCDICKDTTRQRDIICVVQSPKDVIAMEKTKEYAGVYHVLNGVISTAKGILPEDIKPIDTYSRRYKRNYYRNQSDGRRRNDCFISLKAFRKL